jgi:hypothetical protein
MSVRVAFAVMAAGFIAVEGQIPPQYAINITVFHVNPVEYGVAPINMNTADLRGDIYFDLRSKALPIEVGPRGRLLSLPYPLRRNRHCAESVPRAAGG